MATSNHSSAVKVSAAGRVTRNNRGKQLFVRVSDEELDEFAACVVLDAAIHGGEVNMSQVMRRLVRVFCQRTREIAASDVAKDGAKVLKKKARS